MSYFLFKLPDAALFPQPESIRSNQNFTMASFTLVPQPTSFEFRQYHPALLKRTKSKAKAIDTGHTLRRDSTEGPTYNSELLHQGINYSSAMQAIRTRLTCMQTPRATFTPSLATQQAILQRSQRWTVQCAVHLKQSMEQRCMISRLATVAISLAMKCLTTE